MTENEKVKKWFKLELSMREEESLDAIECEDMMDICVKALEEIQQYRAIGTVEDFKNAVEIIRPRKPYKRSFGVFICSLCGEKVGQMVTKTEKTDCMNFCANCGSMIDWSE